MTARKHGEDLRAASRLVIEATRGITDLVEAAHREIGSGPERLGRPFEVPVRAIAALTYGGVRAVTGLVGASIDFALACLAPLLGESAPGVEREALLAILNGVLGDHLHATKNPLAIYIRRRLLVTPLEINREELSVAGPDRRGKLLV